VAYGKAGKMKKAIPVTAGAEYKVKSSIDG